MGATCEVILVAMSLVQPTDSHRFPEKDAIASAQHVYVARRDYCLLQQAMFFRDYWFWQDRLNEVERYHLAWSLLEATRERLEQGDENLPESAEAYLTDLLEVIGEANYAAGQMPLAP